MLEFQVKKEKRLKDIDKQYSDSVQAYEESYTGWLETTKSDIEENNKKLLVLNKRRTREDQDEANGDNCAEHCKRNSGIAS